MNFVWMDYRAEDASLVDSWLDDAAARKTGIEDGWDSCWRAVQADAVNFPGCRDFCKLVYQDGAAVASIVYGVYQGEAVVSEILVDPKRRGEGLGTAILRELVGNLPQLLVTDAVRVTAVVFSDNMASQRAFLKAGFVLESEDKAAQVQNYVWNA